MHLSLVRHAVATEAPPPGGTDDDRPLTEKGIRSFRRAARGMRRLVGPFDRVLTSPLPRALATARLLVEEMRLPIEPEVSLALSPGGDMRDLFAAVGKVAPEGEIALVGHEPFLSTLAAYLLAPGGARVEVALKKGGLCAIDVEALPPPSGGLLRLLLTPRALRLAGRRPKRG